MGGFSLADSTAWPIQRRPCQSYFYKDFITFLKSEKQYKTITNCFRKFLIIF